MKLIISLIISAAIAVGISTVSAEAAIIIAVVLVIACSLVYYLGPFVWGFIQQLGWRRDTADELEVFTSDGRLRDDVFGTPDNPKPIE